jgi:hypothetical protein
MCLKTVRKRKLSGKQAVDLGPYNRGYPNGKDENVL